VIGEQSDDLQIRPARHRVASTVVADVCGVTSPVTSEDCAVLLDQLLRGKICGGDNTAVDD
jgi:hypothetical protein